MKLLWKKINAFPLSFWQREELMVIIVGLCAAAVGFCLWCVIRLWCLNSPDYAVCFAGYPFFAASLAALIWLERKTTDE